MNHGITGYGPREWSEGERRAETYLRVLHGEVGTAERELIDRATQAARKQARSSAAHPVTLVMEALFSLLPFEETGSPIAMTPPIRRVSMLPEKTEFPLHDGLRRFFRSGLLRLAGVN